MLVIAFLQLLKLLDVVRGMCRQQTHDGILRPIRIGPTQERRDLRGIGREMFHRRFLLTGVTSEGRI